MKKKTIKTGMMHRAAELDRASIDVESRTVDLAFSSEAPVTRWFGEEILDHGKKSVRMERLKSAGPLLVNHDSADVVGVVEKAHIDSDRVGRATVRFGKSARADEILQDVNDGIRKGVSVGYMIHKMQPEDFDDDGEPVSYRAVDWEPYEVTLTATPADWQNAGVGRDDERRFETIIESEENQTVTEEERRAAEAAAAAPAPAPAAPAVAPVNEAQVREDGAARERARVADILAIGKRFNMAEFAAEHAGKETTVEAFKDAVLDRMGAPQEIVVSRDIGLSQKEAQNFSILRAAEAVCANNWKNAGFEAECSRAVADKVGRQPHSFFIPPEVARTPHQDQRVLTAGTATDGLELVATNLLAGSFIDVLRNSMRVREAGATILSGLVGDVAIPRKTSGSAAAWVAENIGVAASDAQFDQVTLAPETLGMFTDISRRLTIQSTPSIEGLIRDDLAIGLALEIDRAATQGSGTSNEPEGIENITNVNDVDLGVNGAVLTWPDIVSFETLINTDNALEGSLAYMVNGQVLGELKLIERATNTGLFLMDQDGTMNGYPVIRSNQLRGNITKGTGTALSIMIFGNWRDLLIAEWGVLDVLVDPFTGGAAGTVRIRVLMDVNVNVRHPESFAFSNEVDQT